MGNRWNSFFQGLTRAAYKLLAGLMMMGLAVSGLATGSFAQEAGSWLDQAKAAAYQGDFRAAEKLYRKALAEAPGDSDAQMGLASMFAGQGRVREARVALEALLAQNPGYQPAWYLLGVLYEGEGQVEKARMAYQAYISCNPARVSSDPQVRIKLRRMGLL